MSKKMTEVEEKQLLRDQAASKRVVALLSHIAAGNKDNLYPPENREERYLYIRKMDDSPEQIEHAPVYWAGRATSPDLFDSPGRLAIEYLDGPKIGNWGGMVGLVDFPVSVPVELKPVTSEAVIQPNADEFDLTPPAEEMFMTRAALMTANDSPTARSHARIFYKKNDQWMECRLRDLKFVGHQSALDPTKIWEGEIVRVGIQCPSAGVVQLVEIKPENLPDAHIRSEAGEAGKFPELTPDQAKALAERLNGLSDHVEEPSESIRVKSIYVLKSELDNLKEATFYWTNAIPSTEPKDIKIVQQLPRRFPEMSTINHGWFRHAVETGELISFGATNVPVEISEKKLPAPAVKPSAEQIAKRYGNFRKGLKDYPIEDARNQRLYYNPNLLFDETAFYWFGERNGKKAVITQVKDKPPFYSSISAEKLDAGSRSGLFTSVLEAPAPTTLTEPAKESPSEPIKWEKTASEAEYNAILTRLKGLWTEGFDWSRAEIKLRGVYRVNNATPLSECELFWGDDSAVCSQLPGHPVEVNTKLRFQDWRTSDKASTYLGDFPVPMGMKPAKAIGGNYMLFSAGGDFVSQETISLAEVEKSDLVIDIRKGKVVKNRFGPESGLGWKEGPGGVKISTVDHQKFEFKDDGTFWVYATDITKNQNHQVPAFRVVKDVDGDETVQHVENLFKCNAAGDRYWSHSKMSISDFAKNVRERHLIRVRFVSSKSGQSHQLQRVEVRPKPAKPEKRWVRLNTPDSLDAMEKAVNMPVKAQDAKSFRRTPRVSQIVAKEETVFGQSPYAIGGLVGEFINSDRKKVSVGRLEIGGWDSAEFDEKGNLIRGFMLGTEITPGFLEVRIGDDVFDEQVRTVEEARRKVVEIRSTELLKETISRVIGTGLPSDLSDEKWFHAFATTLIAAGVKVSNEELIKRFGPKNPNDDVGKSIDQKA